MAAMRADLQIGHQVAMEDHLLAGGTLVPEIVGHLAPGEQRADLRADEFGEPVHAASLAPRTPSANARTWSSTLRTASGLALPAASRLAASVSISADATTAASAIRAAAAA